MGHGGTATAETETLLLVDDDQPRPPIDEDDVSSLGEPSTLMMMKAERPRRGSRQASASAAASKKSASASGNGNGNGNGSGRRQDLIAAELATGKQPKTTAKLAHSLAEMHKKLTEAEERNAKLTKVFKETRTMAESAIAEVKRLKGVNADLTAQVEEKTQRLVLQECKYEELQERLDEATAVGNSSASAESPSASRPSGTTTNSAAASARSVISAPAGGGSEAEADLRMMIAQLKTENRMLRESKSDLMDLLYKREAESDYEMTLPPMDEHSAAGESSFTRRGGRRGYAHVGGSSRSMDNYRAIDDLEKRVNDGAPDRSTRSMDDGVVAGLRSRLTKRSSASMVAQSVASDEDPDAVGPDAATAPKRSSMPFMAHFARFEDEISVSQSIPKRDSEL